MVLEVKDSGNPWERRAVRGRGNEESSGVLIIFYLFICRLLTQSEKLT